LLDHKVNKIKLAREPALLKIRDWCAYQERSQNETRQKLYAFGLHQTEVEEIIATLISENFINEERFAIAFAGGKFRIKGWGRQKIKNDLRRHKLSEYCIQKGLGSINESDYLGFLEKLALKKAKTLNKRADAYSRTGALYRFLVSRGFEPGLVAEQLKKLKFTPYESGSEE
jgi:regulatory protein